MSKSKKDDASDTGLFATCPFCGSVVYDPPVLEGDTHRYIEVDMCCFSMEFRAPTMKVYLMPYGQGVSVWPEETQQEIMSALNARGGHPAT